MPEDVQPLDLWVLLAALAYTLYGVGQFASHENSNGLKAGLGGIIFSLMSLDLVPVARRFAFLGERSTAYLGLIALASLIVIEFVGERRGQHVNQRGQHVNEKE